MNMKKLSCIITAFIFLFQGCDYLDVVPKNDVQTVETIFEKRSDVDVWLKGCYVDKSDSFYTWQSGLFGSR